MKHYQEMAQNVINDKNKQDELVSCLLSVIQEWWYAWAIIFCWNYLVWINSRNELIPCVPEEFVRDWEIIDQESFDVCEKMWNERFDTKFSLFSLKIWLELFSKMHIEKQLLLSVDDKYIDWNKAKDYLRIWYKAIPSTYRTLLEKYVWWVKWIKKHLNKIVSALYKTWLTKKNEFVLSERSLVKWFDRNKEHNTDWYSWYLESLWKDRTSCSLEIFHLLMLLKEQKMKIFEGCWISDKIGIFMFIPDACVSSAMQGWLAVSKTDETFEVINITQTTTVEEWIIMITKITKDWVIRL